MLAELPLPPHFDPARVGEVWRVDYAARVGGRRTLGAESRLLRPAVDDSFRTALVLVDAQNTFCTPGFELFVQGRSGTGALDDSRRLCEFVYRNLSRLTQIVPTLDTHRALQIFHPVFLVDADGRHPEPYTRRHARGRRCRAVGGSTRLSPRSSGLDPEYAQSHLRYYVETLATGGKYALTIWPYHAMRAGIGHALVSAIEEAVFFHSIARTSQPDVQRKGDNPLTEHYSVLGPEVDTDLEGEPLGRRNQELIERLLRFDAVVIAGQAKSHCVAWTIRDLLDDATVRERGLARKVYLLEDCTSPVVVPGVADYSADADAAFARFAEAGAHIVQLDRPDRVLARRDRGRGRLALATRTRAAGSSRKRRPTFAESWPSVRTMSAVKSFSPRMSDEPTP